MRRPIQAVIGVAVLLGTSGIVASPAGSAPPETWTTVVHNTTPDTVYFPDDICGPRESYETWFNTVEVNHFTRLDDGSYHVTDFETGYVEVDYVDPSTPDTTARRTETFTVNLTPGGTHTETTTLRLSDDNDLIIRFWYHLTLVDGEPKVEREALVVSGCPA